MPSLGTDRTRRRTSIREETRRLPVAGCRALRRARMQGRGPWQYPSQHVNVPRSPSMPVMSLRGSISSSSSTTSTRSSRPASTPCSALPTSVSSPPAPGLGDERDPLAPALHGPQRTARPHSRVEPRPPTPRTGRIRALLQRPPATPSTGPIRTATPTAGQRHRPRPLPRHPTRPNQRDPPRTPHHCLTSTDGFLGTLSVLSALRILALFPRVPARLSRHSLLRTVPL